MYPQVDGPPQFLDPEATRQMPIPSSFVGRSGDAAAEAGGAEGSGVPRGKMAPGPGFDISVLAPKIKGQKRWVFEWPGNHAVPDRSEQQGGGALMSYPISAGQDDGRRPRGSSDKHVATDELPEYLPFRHKGMWIQGLFWAGKVVEVVEKTTCYPAKPYVSCIPASSRAIKGCRSKGTSGWLAHRGQGQAVQDR